LDFIWNDLTDPGPIRMMDYWTRFSKSGVNDDPTLATAEKGKIIFEAVVSNFVKFARGERVD
jgi:creatinine amidohydrolase/Fe(II)-dependent formamide hydrolase-like protein